MLDHLVTQVELDISQTDA